MDEKLNQNIPPELSADDAELLSAYIDEMLTDAERAALEKRLDDEAFLRGELQAMRRTVEWLHQLPELKAPRDFTIRAEDVGADPPKKVVVMPRPNWWLSIAAAVVVGLCGVIVALAIVGPRVGNVFNTVVNGLNEGGGAAMSAPVANAPTQAALQPLTQVEQQVGALFTQTPAPTSTTTPTATPLATQTANLREAATIPPPTPTISSVDDSAEMEAAEEADNASQAQVFAGSGGPGANISESEVATLVAKATDEAVMLYSRTQVANTRIVQATTSIADIVLEGQATASRGQPVELAAVQSTATALAHIMVTPTLNVLLPDTNGDGLVSTIAPAMGGAVGGAPLPTPTAEVLALAAEATEESSPDTFTEQTPSNIGESITLPQLDIPLPDSQTSLTNLARRIVLFIVMRIIGFVGSAP